MISSAGLGNVNLHFTPDQLKQKEFDKTNKLFGTNLGVQNGQIIQLQHPELNQNLRTRLEWAQNAGLANDPLFPELNKYLNQNINQQYQPTQPMQPAPAPAHIAGPNMVSAQPQQPFLPPQAPMIQTPEAYMQSHPGYVDPGGTGAPPFGWNPFQNVSRETFQGQGSLNIQPTSNQPVFLPSSENAAAQGTLQTQQLLNPSMLSQTMALW